MVIYAIRTKPSRDVEHWLSETSKRSQEPSMLKNPFKMRFKKVRKKKGLLLVFDVRPLYPNFTLWGWPLAFLIFVVFGPSLWVWAGLFLGMLGFFWTSEFYFFMTKLGIKRAGYKGPFKRVRLSKVIKEVMF